MIRKPTRAWRCDSLVGGPLLEASVPPGAVGLELAPTAASVIAAGQDRGELAKVKLVVTPSESIESHRLLSGAARKLEPGS